MKRVWVTPVLGLVCGGAALLADPARALAEDAAEPAAAQAPAAATEAPKPVRAKKARGKVIREKEAEGTEAPDRFQAETGIKSTYRLNGESLEVDPD